jgi:hypothetical protein
MASFYAFDGAHDVEKRFAIVKKPDTSDPRDISGK